MSATETEDSGVAPEVTGWTCTRDELIEALTHLRAEFPWPPPIRADGTLALNAESMADAILAGLTPDPPSDHVPVSPPDLHRLVLLALPVTPDDDAFVERMRAASEGGP